MGINTANSVVTDFETDTNWFLARGWRGGVYAGTVFFAVLFLFNFLSDFVGAGRHFEFAGREVLISAIGRRVAFSAHWIVPTVIISLVVVVNRIAAFYVIRTVDSLSAKQKVFSAFIYFGEFLSIATMKYSGGVESPMCFYFLGHIVALGSVAARRSLARHIAFISVLFACVAVTEYAGLIRHTDLCAPPLGLYRSASYVFIITMAAVGYMVYIGLSTTNILRKFRERWLALERAMEARRDADLFMDLMAHDLTNFNHAMLNGIGLLERRTELDDAQRKYVNSLKRQLDRSNGLISNVKALSQSHGITGETLCAVDLNESMERVIKAVRTLYPDRNTKISFTPLDGARATAGEHLDYVLLNVVENAVKHCPKETAEVWIDITACDGGRQFAVRIEDEGPGIPDDMKGRIFDRYARIERERGIGLGLALSRMIMEKYGGTISVEDRVQGARELGCVFYVRVPAER